MYLVIRYYFSVLQQQQRYKLKTEKWEKALAFGWSWYSVHSVAATWKYAFLRVTKFGIGTIEPNISLRVVKYFYSDSEFWSPVFLWKGQGVHANDFTELVAKSDIANAWQFKFTIFLNYSAVSFPQNFELN